MLKVLEASDKKSLEEAIMNFSTDEKVVIVNPSYTIHYLSLQYFKRFLYNFEHIDFTFILNTDNDLTVCLEAIDLCFPYIIFSNKEEIMLKLQNRAAQNNSYISHTLEQMLDFIENCKFNIK